MTIYLPIDDFSSYSCYEIRDMNTIRAYITTPVYNSTVDYTDFYINSHYLSKSGIANFNNFSILPTCVNVDTFTHDVFYRNDLPDILLCFIIIVMFVSYFPLKLLKLFRKRGY